MFKNPEEFQKSRSTAKSSVVRNIKKQIVEQMPAIEPYMEAIIPKKGTVQVQKCKEHVQFVVCDEKILFVEHNKVYIPTLRLLHQYPVILPKYQVDAGAIKFVLRGADVMSPGLLSSGGDMEDVEEGKVVGIYAEGKEHALGIGRAVMSTAEVREVREGRAVETVTILNDLLWKSGL